MGGQCFTNISCVSCFFMFGELSDVMLSCCRYILWYSGELGEMHIINMLPLKS